MSHVGFGANTLIKGATWDDTFYIELLTAGELELRSQGSTQLIGTQSILLIPPRQPVSFDFSPDCRKLIIRIKQKTLIDHLKQLAGPTSPIDLQFAPVTTTDDPKVRSLLRSIRYLCDELDDPGSATCSSRLRRGTINLVLDNLLSAIPHSRSSQLNNLLSHHVPQPILAAEHYITEHLEQDLQLHDIVQASGTSERTLYKLFRQYRSTTPMAWLKAQRLHLVHEALLRTPSVSSGQTITQIALSAGFSHLGNFAADYKKRYGELPSETQLRAAWPAPSSSQPS